MNDPFWQVVSLIVNIFFGIMLGACFANVRRTRIACEEMARLMVNVEKKKLNEKWSKALESEN